MEGTLFYNSCIDGIVPLPWKPKRNINTDFPFATSMVGINLIGGMRNFKLGRLRSP